MKFEISRDGALKQLDAFINSELANYGFKRNFDLGPKDKSNVSCLSPYISHRLITEYEVAKSVLSKLPYQKVEKYIQEIFWRVYWKGWLELRPQVWTDFLEDLNDEQLIALLDKEDPPVIAMILAQLESKKKMLILFGTVMLQK